MNNNTPQTQIDNRVLQIPIEDIIPNRFQPRLAFDESSLQDLANSIKQHGIIQPLVLRRIADKYEIIAGERRYKAATMAGLVSVPAIITDLDDNTSAEVAIVENVQRKDLTAIEEAKSYKALLDKGYMSQDELAKKMGLSQAAISNKLRLLTLDEAVQNAVLEEKISERHARTLLKIKDTVKQKELVQKIINERLTVRQLDEEIKKMQGTDNISTEEGAPIVPNPNIDNMVNNSVDIIQNKPVENILDDTKPATPEPISSTSYFGSQDKIPNKFFNFLEDESANMTMDEPEVNIDDNFVIPEIQPGASIPTAPVEEIEMLDDFVLPDATSNASESPDSLQEVVSTIRNLHLDSDKVKVEELNLPNEYRINIIIKKDKL